jgi:predicted AlkP superfamily pyrophosphatase or phosphodiesterase
MKRFLLAAIAGTIGCAAPAVQLSDPPVTGPSLVVLVTVDQLRGDYIDRDLWAHQLTGGLSRLASTGAWFTNAMHDHAITETAPGHASIGSGRHPVNTGIAANTVGVADPANPLVEEPLLGASPVRYQGTSIADWLVARYPSARVFSASGKDRGAILPLGRYRGQVYWYVQSGRFTTSTYYQTQLPRWVRDFNSRRIAASWAGRTWRLLLDESGYPQPDSVPAESFGRGYMFPHAMPDDPAAATQSLFTYPWLDELTLQFALQAVRALQLGQGNRTDLLAISLSGTDYIGHRWGPDSRELHDQVLRMDRALGGFLDTLFTLVDSRRVVIALTGDHGVAPIPEVASAASVAPDARRVTFGSVMSEIRGWLHSVGGDTASVSFGSGAFVVDRNRLTAQGVNLDSLRARFMGLARATPGVANVTTIEELATRDTVSDAHARRWLHMFRPGGEVLAVVTLHPYNMWGSIPATHGTPHDYDAHVPLIFWGEPFRQGRYANRVSTVDLAPTLARAAGVQPLERVDGRVLSEALR